MLDARTVGRRLFDHRSRLGGGPALERIAARFVRVLARLELDLLAVVGVLVEIAHSGSGS